MKISKKALLDSINTALAADEANKIEWEQAVRSWRKRCETKWLQEKLPQWRELRDLITTAVKRGRPITQEQVTDCLKRSDRYSSSYLSDHTYNPNGSPPATISFQGRNVSRQRVPVKDLQALKLFLEQAQDDSFSLESLSRLGFKAPAWVFRAAVRGQGSDG